MFVSPAILHADADAFFAAVAQRDDPALRGRAVIVGGGVVLAASYEAKRLGVRSGMGGARARRLCPQAIVAAPQWSAYVEASKAIFAVFEQTAPRVEKLSIEEAFLDIGTLAPTVGAARAVAARLRERIRDEVGLAVSVGVGRTKLVAKLASRAAKPDGLLVVAPERERAFLDALRVEQLWGVGPATTGKLRAARLETVGQLAQLSEPELVAMLGRASGRRLHALVQNRDRRPVEADRPPRSFGAQRALGRSSATLGPDGLGEALAGLAERATSRMRSSGHAGRTVVLRLRFADYTRATRSCTLPEPAVAPEPIAGAARLLLAEALPTITRRGLTLIGLTISNLHDVSAAAQLALALDDDAARR